MALLAYIIIEVVWYAVAVQVASDCSLQSLLRYPLAREGVYAPGGLAFLAHTRLFITITEMLKLKFLTFERSFYFQVYDSV